MFKSNRRVDTTEITINGTRMQKPPYLKFTSTYIGFKAKQNGVWEVRSFKSWNWPPNILILVIVRNNNPSYCRRGGIRPRGETAPKTLDIPPTRKEERADDYEAPTSWFTMVPLDENSELEIYAEVADDIQFTAWGWLEVGY